MSNLKLPTMTHENLSKLVPVGKIRKLAYATEARHHTDGTIVVTQHGNIIATMTTDSLYVSNAGWDSTTTATRLRKILGDNKTGYYVRIRDYGMRFYNDSHTELDSSFHSASFNRLGTVWALDYADVL